MATTTQTALLAGIAATTAVLLAVAIIILYIRLAAAKRQLRKQEEDTRRRIYELAILGELGERAGYSLDVEKIIDIITGSLHQFIEYTAVAYMLIEPEKIIFKINLEESVARPFIDDVRDRMLKSLSALLDATYTPEHVEEILTGAILDDSAPIKAASLFNIPLVIGDQAIGILTVADTNPGLYKEEEMTILYKITNQASRAVTRLQEVVQTEQRKLNAMVASMSEGVVMTDTDYRVMVVNPAAKRAVGLTSIEQPTIFDFIDHLEGHYDIRGKLEESVKLNRTLTSDEVVINDRFYQIVVSPVKSSFTLTSKKTLGGVVIFRDITHEKEVEQLREEFTSMMAHELRSPLTGIQKIAQLLSRPTTKKRDPAKLQHYFVLIDRSAEDMLMLINDMLDVAKIEAGKFELVKKETNLHELIADRLKLFEAQAAEQQITLQQMIPATVPDTIKADPRRLQQVFNNLLSNALKFTEPGEAITIQALIHSTQTDLNTTVQKAGMSWYLPPNTEPITTQQPCLILAVTHPGPGISRDNIPRLFSKFSQVAPATKSSGKSTGLGLVVIKGIAEAHGGTVGAASVEGQGSTFYITIPLSESPSSKPPAPET